MEELSIRMKLKKLNNKQLYRLLSIFKRDEVRKFAKANDVPLGKNKECTLYNLIQFKDKISDVNVMITLGSEDNDGNECIMEWGEDANFNLLWFCSKCNARFMDDDLDDDLEKCPSCGARIVTWDYPE